MSEQDDSAREALRPELPDRTEELREAKRVAEEALLTYSEAETKRQRAHFLQRETQACAVTCQSR